MSSQEDLESVMNEYVAAGVSEVAYTEFDVKFDSLPYDDAGLEQQAQDYTTVIKACLNVEACVGWTIWDWTDKYSVSNFLMLIYPFCAHTYLSHTLRPSRGLSSAPPPPVYFTAFRLYNLFCDWKLKFEFSSGCQTLSPARAELVYMMRTLSQSQPSFPSHR